MGNYAVAVLVGVLMVHKLAAANEIVAVLLLKKPEDLNINPSNRADKALTVDILRQYLYGNNEAFARFGGKLEKLAEQLVDAEIKRNHYVGRSSTDMEQSNGEASITRPYQRSELCSDSLENSNRKSQVRAPQLTPWEEFYEKLLELFEKQPETSDLTQPEEDSPPITIDILPSDLSIDQSPVAYSEIWNQGPVVSPDMDPNLIEIQSNPIIISPGKQTGTTPQQHYIYEERLLDKDNPSKPSDSHLSESDLKQAHVNRKLFMDLNESLPDQGENPEIKLKLFRTKAEPVRISPNQPEQRLVVFQLPSELNPGLETFDFNPSKNIEQQFPTVPKAPGDQGYAVHGPQKLSPHVKKPSPEQYQVEEELSKVLRKLSPKAPKLSKSQLSNLHQQLLQLLKRREDLGQSLLKSVRPKAFHKLPEVELSDETLQTKPQLPVNSIDDLLEWIVAQTAPESSETLPQHYKGEEPTTPAPEKLSSTLFELQEVLSQALSELVDISELLREADSPLEFPKQSELNLPEIFLPHAGRPQENNEAGIDTDIPSQFPKNIPASARLSQPLRSQTTPKSSDISDEDSPVSLKLPEVVFELPQLLINKMFSQALIEIAAISELIKQEHPLSESPPTKESELNLSQENRGPEFYKNIPLWGVKDLPASVRLSQPEAYRPRGSQILQELSKMFPRHPELQQKSTPATQKLPPILLELPYLLMHKVLSQALLEKLIRSPPGRAKTKESELQFPDFNNGGGRAIYQPELVSKWEASQKFKEVERSDTVNTASKFSIPPQLFGDLLGYDTQQAVVSQNLPELSQGVLKTQPFKFEGFRESNKPPILLTKSKPPRLNTLELSQLLSSLPKESTEPSISKSSLAWPENEHDISQQLWQLPHLGKPAKSAHRRLQPSESFQIPQSGMYTFAVSQPKPEQLAENQLYSTPNVIGLPYETFLGQSLGLQEPQGYFQPSTQFGPKGLTLRQQYQDQSQPIEDQEMLSEGQTNSGLYQGAAETAGDQLTLSEIFPKSYKSTVHHAMLPETVSWPKQFRKILNGKPTAIPIEPELFRLLDLKQSGTAPELFEIQPKLLLADEAVPTEQVESTEVPQTSLNPLHAALFSVQYSQESSQQLTDLPPFPQTQQLETTDPTTNSFGTHSAATEPSRSANLPEKQSQPTANRIAEELSPTSIRNSPVASEAEPVKEEDSTTVPKSVTTKRSPQQPFYSLKLPHESTELFELQPRLEMDEPQPEPSERPEPQPELFGKLMQISDIPSIVPTDQQKVLADRLFGGLSALFKVRPSLFKDLEELVQEPAEATQLGMGKQPQSRMLGLDAASEKPAADALFLLKSEPGQEKEDDLTMEPYNLENIMPLTIDVEPHKLKRMAKITLVPLPYLFS